MKHKELIETIRTRIERQHLRVLAFVVLWLSLGVLLWWGLAMQTPALQPVTLIPPEPSPVTGDVLDGAEDALVAPIAEPRTLRIPSLGIVAPFETPVGINDDGTIGVPDSFETVSYYRYGPTPGALGPAVILGHVDSYEGPAVLYSLGQVQAGDRIEVERADGTIAVFSVTAMERVEQGAFPNDRVYGNIPYAGLRLITCSGTFNRGIQRYSHNLIVYAELIDVETSEPTE
jgi:sortase (surface protein transpeptidase)